jgi:hypothetical protein
VSARSEQRESRISEGDAGFLQRLRRRAVQIAKAVGALVAFAATMTGLMFGLWPSLKPAEPPATRGAILTNATVDRVSFGQYLDRAALSRAPYRVAELEQRGVIVGFEFNIRGYLNKHVPLRWQLIDARTGDQVDQSRDYFITPRADEDHNSWSLWVPLPRRRSGRFFVEIQLLGNRRRAVPLGRIRTDRFAGT